MNRAPSIAALLLLVGCGSSTPEVQEVNEDAASSQDVVADAPIADDTEPTSDAAKDSAKDSGTDTKPTSGDAAVDTAKTGDTAAAGVPVLVVDDITGATTAELTMIRDGVALANETMKTKCFKDFVLSASWTETNGLTQAQIYEKLCSVVVTIDVEMFMGTWYQNNVSKTIGYENEPGKVYMNRYFVDTAYDVANNLVHEAEGHSQGFSHYGVKATSVPYGLNDAFEACSPVGP